MEELTEGATRLLVSTHNVGSGPGAKDKDAPFYNPGMALNRDLSVLLVATEASRRGRELDIADVLAGTGARSLRLAHEVDAPLIVHANDGDPTAIAAMEEARSINGILRGRLKIRHGNAHVFLAERRFDIIDVDPFGSSAPFLDASVRACRHDGLVCLTFTDTGALSGTYPKACRRRYGAEPLHAPEWRTEVGLRILQAAIIRAAGRIDRLATPVFAVARGHWMRIVMRITDDKAGADAAAKEIGFVAEHEVTGQAIRVDSGAGPIWWGKLHDLEMVEAMQEAAGQHSVSDEAKKLVSILVAEASSSPFWIHIPHAHRRLGGAYMPKRIAIEKALNDAESYCMPTHMDAQGIRTDANPGLFAAVWKQTTTNA
jgi:tRNA (guanine26-N2/guanine27-N2)-dimethyltransferase